MFYRKRLAEDNSDVDWKNMLALVRVKYCSGKFAIIPNFTLKNWSETCAETCSFHYPDANQLHY